MFRSIVPDRFTTNSLTMLTTSKMKKGFTLIEIMVSVSIFLVVMTVSMGSILSVINANRQTSSLKSVMDNLSFVLESMSREIRFGHSYNCVGAGDAPNCVNGNGAFAFVSSDGRAIQYTFDPSTSSIKQSINGSSPAPLTGPDVKITSVKFFVVGANPAPADIFQPYMLMQVNGIAGWQKPQTSSSFTIQTSVSQRVLDRAP